MKLIKEDLRVWDQESIDNQNALASIAKEIKKLFDESGDVNYAIIDYDIFDYGNEILVKDVYDPDDIGNFIEDKLGFRFRVENTNHSYGDVYVDTTQEYEDENGDIHTRVSREYLNEKLTESGKMIQALYTIAEQEDLIKKAYNASHDKKETMIKIFADNGFDEDDINDFRSLLEDGDSKFYFSLDTLIRDMIIDAIVEVLGEEFADNVDESLGKETTKCALCKKEIKGYGNNGQPLTSGKVCDECNKEVIKARLSNLSESKNIVANIYDKDENIIETRHFSSRKQLDDYVNTLDNLVDMKADKNVYKNKNGELATQDVWKIIIDTTMTEGKKKKEQGYFVNYNSGNSEQNQAIFNKNMTVNTSGESEGQGLGEAIKTEPINFRKELKRLDLEKEEFGELSDLYDYLEYDLSFRDKVELAALIKIGDYGPILTFLNKKIEELETKDEDDIIDLGTFYKEDDLI